MTLITRRRLLLLLGSLGTSVVSATSDIDSTRISPQPYFASVRRALEALSKLGSPISLEHARLLSELEDQHDASSVAAAELILDHYTLARLCVQLDGSLSISAGGARRLLIEQGWCAFLVRIDNLPEQPSPIVLSPASGSLEGLIKSGGHLAQRPYLMDALNKAPMIEQMWLYTRMYGATELGDLWTDVIQLSGFRREYHVIQLFSRDHGAKQTDLASTIPGEFIRSWLGTVSHTFTFDCLATRSIELSVLDSDNRGCMASLTIKDSRGRIYPLQAMRLAPDMYFQKHIYRGDGETIRLPAGDYVVDSWRGPEYHRGTQKITIAESNEPIAIRLKRWIDPTHWGWYSGDTHIHAAGCAHYQSPTEGVSPETVIRHIRGEGLWVGEVLTWGPSWYYQKQFFTGTASSPPAHLEHPDLQAANNSNWTSHTTPKDGDSLLRYDVEVSGFPSSLCGHLALLRLKQHDYPGTTLIEEWPSWNLPIIRWAKAQGAVVGYAHCGGGMNVPSNELPNYDIPRFSGVGTNEAIVDVTHGLTDFLAGCNLSPIAELNAWYHMLNCGFRLGFVGETDYPCAADERPGVGRTYVRLKQPPREDAGYEEWVHGLLLGRVYCGDGRSHFLNFEVQGQGSGEELALRASRVVTVKGTVAGWLPLRVDDAARVAYARRWHLENARVGSGREVFVELIVNGQPFDRVAIVADGQPRDVHFRMEITRSSWVAMRILPSAHTNPVFVSVDQQPVRASRRSAIWCRECVDTLWRVKSPFIRKTEQGAAEEAFNHAHDTYRAISRECNID